jgi:hypothetical protein
MRNVLTILSLGLMPVPVLFADSASFVGDQIAAHFEQVFGEDEPEAHPRSWMLGDDESDTLPWGSRVNLELQGSWVGEGDLEDSENRLESNYFGMTLGVTVPMGSGRSLSVVGAASRYRITESGPEQRIFPFRQLWRLDSGLIYTVNISPRWDVFGGGIAVWSGSDGDRLEEHLDGMLIGGAAFTIHPNLKIAFGASAGTTDYLTSSVFPLVIVDWRINQRSRFAVRNGVFYEYALSDSWRDVIGASFEVRQWISHAPDQEFEGRFRRDLTLLSMDLSFNLLFRHRFDSGLEWETKLGLAHVGSHTVFEDSKEIDDQVVEPALGLSMGLRYRF